MVAGTQNRSDAEGGSGFGHRGDDGDGGFGGDEDAPSRADEASAWRRAPEPEPARGANRYGSNSRGGDNAGSDRYPSRTSSNFSRSSDSADTADRDLGSFRSQRSLSPSPSQRGEESSEPRADAASDWRSARTGGGGGGGGGGRGREGGGGCRRRMEEAPPARPL